MSSLNTLDLTIHRKLIRRGLAIVPYVLLMLATAVLGAAVIHASHERTEHLECGRH